MKKSVFALLLLTSVQVGFSQTKREIIEEDPKASPNLRIELTPLNMYSEIDASIQWSARVAYRYQNKFAISAEFRKEYDDDQLQTYIQPQAYNYEKPVKGFAYEVIGTYFFKAKEKETDEWLPIKSRQTGYRTVEVTVDPVPMTRLALYGVRLGYGSEKATNSVDAVMTNVNDASDTKMDFAIPLQTSGLVFAGLNATRIKNVKVRYPIYGIRRKQVIREYYLDGIYQTSNKFSDVTYYDYPDIKNYHVAVKNMRKYGARIGVFSSNTGKIINLGYGFELGIHPKQGPFMASEGYFNFRVVLSLFHKVAVQDSEE